MTFEAITHVIIGLLQLILLIVLVRQARRTFSWYAMIAAAIIAGLVYDNFVLAFGAQIGFGATLSGLNTPRFWIHALLTPMMIIFAIGVARWAGLTWAKGKLWHAIFCTLAVALIAMGSLQDILRLDLEQYDVVERGLTGYRNKYVLLRGPPIPAVVAIVVLIVVGALVVWRTRWPWLLVGATLMFFGALFGLRTPILASLGELMLAIGVVTTAVRFLQRMSDGGQAVDGSAAAVRSLAR